MHPAVVIIYHVNVRRQLHTLGALKILLITSTDYLFWPLVNDFFFL